MEKGWTERFSTRERRKSWHAHVAQVFIIHTHLSALEFASSESNSNVVELIPPAASRADAKNNIFMVTTSPSPEADDDMTLSCINQK